LIVRELHVLREAACSWKLTLTEICTFEEYFVMIVCVCVCVCVWILLLFCCKWGIGKVLNDFSFLNSLGNRKFLMNFFNNFGLRVSNIFTFERIRSPCVVLFCQRQCEIMSDCAIYSALMK
jgi:hypothetical protein